LKAGILRIADKLGARLSTHTLKRLLKNRDYVWKRMRRSSRGKRNERDFRTAKAHLDKLRAVCRAADRDFDLVYFDGAGFSLIPCVPYAWQLRGETLEIQSVHSQRLNVLGFLNLNGSYEWLPVSAYQSFKDLSEALDEVLRGIGSKYRLSFAH
jgi:hypothetical protein